MRGRAAATALACDVETVHRCLSPGASARASVTRDAHPVALDMYDSGEEVVAEISMPGLSPGDLVISADEHRLTLQGKFSQTILLPDGVDAGKVRAQYQNGVLRLALPKPPAASKTIPIDFQS